MPARVVEESHAWSPAAAVLALLLAVPGFWVWRMGVRFFFPGEPSAPVLWVLTLLPLLALALYWTLVWIFLRRSSGRHAPSTLVKSHGAHPVPRAGRN